MNNKFKEEGRYYTKVEGVKKTAYLVGNSQDQVKTWIKTSQWSKKKCCTC